jgi:hypothetical protein
MFIEGKPYVGKMARALLSNGSVNLNNRETCVFYAVRAKQKHTDIGSLLPGNVAVNMHQQQWRTVFSVGSVQRRATWRAKETDPRKLWIPEEVDCRLQEGVPPFNSGMAQKEQLQEILDPRELWTTEGCDRSRKEGYPLCRTQA